MLQYQKKEKLYSYFLQFIIIIINYLRSASPARLLYLSNPWIKQNYQMFIVHTVNGSNYTDFVLKINNCKYFLYKLKKNYHDA